MTNLLTAPIPDASTTDPDPAPVDLDDLAGSYRRSRVLLAALELGVFEFTRVPRSAADVERHAGLHPRSARLFLDALVGLEVLTSSADGQYENSATTERYLVSSSNRFVGGDLLERSQRSYCSWYRLAEALRTGEPQVEPPATLLGGAAPPEPSHCRRSVVFDRFAELIELPEGSWWSVIATDTALAVTLANAHPTTIGNVVTTAAAAPAVRAQLVLAGLERRVAVAECDVFEDRLPPTALSIVDSVRRYSATERERLLDRVRTAMPNGGSLVVIDDVIDDDRRVHAPALLSALEAVVEGAPTAGYTASDFDRWCRAAGFAGTEIAPLTGAASAAVAYTNQEDLT